MSENQGEGDCYEMTVVKRGNPGWQAASHKVLTEGIWEEPEDRFPAYSHSVIRGLVTTRLMTSPWALQSSREDWLPQRTKTDSWILAISGSSQMPSVGIWNLMLLDSESTRQLRSWQPAREKCYNNPTAGNKMLDMLLSSSPWKSHSIFRSAVKRQREVLNSLH